jgi:hypothetical protein
VLFTIATLGGLVVSMLATGPMGLAAGLVFFIFLQMMGI